MPTAARCCTTCSEWAAPHEQACERRHDSSRTVAAGRRVPARPSARAQPSATFVPRHAASSRFDVGAGAAPAAALDQRAGQSGFGAQISEAGGGYTWAVNSRLNQLTAWSNDPVADPPREWFLLQDRAHARGLERGAVGLGRRADGYRVAHGQGQHASSATGAAIWR